MGKAIGRILVILFGSLVFLTATGTTTSAKTIEVCPNGSLTSISAAVTQANSGDTILVNPGIYQEQIIIDKNIQLIGVKMPTIDGNGQGDVITIEADGVSVKGFAIINSGKTLEETHSGIKIKGNGNLIEDNQLTNNLFGIYLERSAENVIRRNLIKGRPVVRDTDKATLDEDTALSGYDIKFEGDGGDGIHLFDSPNNLMEYNIITDSRDGIYFDYSEHNQVIGNEITNVRYGIHYMYSWHNIFENNLLTHNVAGAAPMFSKYIVFRNNVMAHSRGHRSYGILFAHCDHSLAEGNIVLDNTRGIFLDHSLHNTIRNNLIAMNDIGLDFISSSTDNVIAENNFIDNMQQVVLVARSVGRGNVFNEEGRGNYWSDYRGFDLDRDGVGDISHHTGDPFTYLMNKAPAVRLFLNSPAATALEFSERIFPIINIPKVEDEFPLIEPQEIEIPAFAKFEKPISNKTFALYSFLMLMIGLSLYKRGLSMGRLQILVKGGGGNN